MKGDVMEQQKLRLYRQPEPDFYTSLTKKMEKISINKPKIGKIRDISAKITGWLILLFGLLCALIDVKSGFYGIASNIVVFLFCKKLLSKWKLWQLILVAIVFKIAVYLCLDLDYLAYITTSFLTYSLFFPEDLFGKTSPKVLEMNSEVFYMDEKQVKFIHLSIISQRHLYRFFDTTLEIKEVKMIFFNRRRITIYSKYTDYKVVKLAKEEVDQIYEFVKTNFPNLLTNPEVIRSIKTKNNVTKIVLISAAIILCLIVIKTWGPNETNWPITYIFSVLICMLGLWIIWKIIRKR